MRHFIVVEGLIGVGKSSLCRLLRDTWGARLVMEPAETNPFLESFYTDTARFAFPVQMFYLVNRWRQQAQIRQQDLFEQGVVSDYLFAKDRLFAEKTLDETELDLYDRFAGALGETAPVPDLVILLRAPLEVLLTRIAKRRAPGEWAIEPEYLKDLQERYDALFNSWTDCPVLHVDNTNLDYVNEPRDRETVLQMIENALAGGQAGAPGSSDREAQPDLFGQGA